MSKHRIYKKIEIVGSSKISIEDAISNVRRRLKTWIGLKLSTSVGILLMTKWGTFRLPLK